MILCSICYQRSNPQVSKQNNAVMVKQELDFIVDPDSHNSCSESSIRSYFFSILPALRMIGCDTQNSRPIFCFLVLISVMSLYSLFFYCGFARLPLMGIHNFEQLEEVEHFCPPFPGSSYIHINTFCVHMCSSMRSCWHAV